MGWAQRRRQVVTQWFAGTLRALGSRLSLAGVFLLVAFWNVSVSSGFFEQFASGKGAVRETAQEVRNVNLHLQLRFYQLLTQLRPIPFRADNVSLAYIDDDVHWTLLYGNEPTDRGFLAALIHNASLTRTKAAAIGVDVELLAPRNFPPGTDAPDRAAENRELLDEIHFADFQGVPVVLGGVLASTKGARSIELPNIFSAGDLLSSLDTDCVALRCPQFGYINLPSDQREIPLTSAGAGSGDSHSAIRSFALALAEADKGKRLVEDNTLLSAAIEHKGTLDGTFLSEDLYPKVSVVDLYNGVQSAEQACAGRIVLIGGHWRDLQGSGAPVDQHLSPAGYESGLGLHANYIESLIQHQFTREVPAWIGVLLDLAVGLAIYTAFERTVFWWQSLIVLAIALVVPIIAACAVLDFTNRYLDFLLPLELYFLHLLYEFVKEFVSQRSSLTPPQTAPPGPQTPAPEPVLATHSAGEP